MTFREFLNSTLTITWRRPEPEEPVPEPGTYRIVPSDTIGLFNVEVCYLDHYEHKGYGWQTAYGTGFDGPLLTSLSEEAAERAIADLRVERNKRRFEAAKLSEFKRNNPPRIVPPYKVLIK